jgi:putative ABC transport system permease protein
VSSSTQTEANQAVPVPALPVSSAEATPLERFFQELRTGKNYQRSLVGANLGSALESVLGNRVRSFLTVLGIVIGIAAVIGAITLAQGVGSFFSSAIAGLGSNTVIIQGSAAGTQRNAPSLTKQSHPSLTLSDLQFMSKLPHVVAVSPALSLNAQVVYNSQNWRTTIVGASTDLQTIQSWQLAQGLWFSSTQDTAAEPVAVLGDITMRNLFGTTGVNPIGKQIRIRTQIFRVVGVLAPKGGVSVGDDAVYIPFRAFQVRFTNSAYLNQMVLEVDDQSNVSTVVQRITESLELTHHIPRGTPDDFTMTTSAQLLQQTNVATQAIATLLGGIAAISLIVGGVGIINVMLVSVTERTREIGIRMSLGARRSDIRNQFLAEALVLCLIGGLLGMLLGIFIGWLMVGVLISAIVSGAGGSSVPVVITPTTLILPFAVSAGLGLIFGLYPAIRASRLDPIAAIRRAK